MFSKTALHRLLSFATIITYGIFASPSAHAIGSAAGAGKSSSSSSSSSGKTGGSAYGSGKSSSSSSSSSGKTGGSAYGSGKSSSSSSSSSGKTGGSAYGSGKSSSSSNSGSGKTGGSAYGSGKSSSSSSSSSGKTGGSAYGSGKSTSSTTGSGKTGGSAYGSGQSTSVNGGKNYDSTSKSLKDPYSVGLNTEMGGSLARQASLNATYAGIAALNGRSMNMPGGLGKKGTPNAAIAADPKNLSARRAAAQAREDYTRAYYNSLKSTYEKAKVNPHTQSLAIGPVEALARTRPGVTAAQLNAARALDEGYRTGKVSITTPGITLGAYANAYYNDINKMSAVQRLGLDNSVVAVGTTAALDKAMKALGLDALGTTTMGVQVDVYSSFSLGGLVGISIDSPAYASYASVKDAIQDTAFHELNHAGHKATQAMAQMDMTNMSLSAAQREKAKAAYEAATTAYNDWMSNVSVSSLTDDQHAALAADDYYDSVTEFSSFNSQPNAKAEWAEGLASKTGMSITEANEIANAIARDPAYQDMERSLNDFADGKLGQ